MTFSKILENAGSREFGL